MNQEWHSSCLVGDLTERNGEYKRPEALVWSERPYLEEGSITSNRSVFQQSIHLSR
jgi:hypothetical protein